MQHPNVMIISTHDTGRHFGCYGAPTVQSPAIDRLAGGGVRFSNMFAACPICSPSRGALLTGRYPLENGLVGLTGGCWNWELHDYDVHLSHRLRTQGYHTAMFGLQHETSYIDRMGFDDTAAHGVKDGDRERSAVDVAADVCDFLQAYDGTQPFYAQVGFRETHTAYTFAGCEPDRARGAWVPPYAQAHDWAPWSKILARFDGDTGRIPQHIAELQGSVRRADEGVGMILDALDQAGLAEDTLVLFTTDHGPELPGAKWTMYDAGLGIAFIMRWPGGGVDGGRTCDWLLGNVDFLPTLFDLLQLDAPDDLQGRSFAAACRQAQPAVGSPRDVVYSNWVDGLNFSVRTERYKLIRNLVPLDSTGRACRPYELYDLELDPLELTDVVDEPAYREVAGRLRGRLDEWLTQMDDPTVHGELTPADHDEMLAEYTRRYHELHG